MKNSKAICLIAKTQKAYTLKGGAMYMVVASGFTLLAVH